MMASAIAEHTSTHGVKTIAFIGQADALGETFYAEVAKFAQRITWTWWRASASIAPIRA